MTFSSATELSNEDLNYDRERKNAGRNDLFCHRQGTAGGTW